MADAAARLPRLLYLADVPVEATYHGSALLHRLLECYPQDRITICEAGTFASLEPRRLAGVDYRIRLQPLRRLQTTRFGSGYARAMLRMADLRARVFRPLVQEVRPDAILTVAHGSSWLTAAALARWADVPLHVICHDDWTGAGEGPNGFESRKQCRLANVFRNAATLFCVSTPMAESYARRFGAKCIVLLPSRAADASRFDSVPEQLHAPRGAFTCSFAGTINSPSVVNSLQQMAECLDSLGGRLQIFGPLTLQQAEACGLLRHNVDVRGLSPAAELLHELRRDSHCLFVPLSFAAAERANMELSFPSKLADYTSTGVPLLMRGPEHAAGVRWARDHEGVAEIVTSESAADLLRALERLKTDTAYRAHLGEAALAIGQRVFDHAVAFETFCAGLIGIAGRAVPIDAELASHCWKAPGHAAAHAPDA